MNDVGNIFSDQFASTVLICGSITFLAIYAIALTWMGVGNVKYVTTSAIGMAAVIGIIPALSLAHSTREPFPLTITQESKLRSLLCRIDRRCPTVNLTVRGGPKEQVAKITAHQTS